MSGEIRKGDLVMVVRPATCGCANSVGFVFVVMKVEISRRQCGACGRHADSEALAFKHNNFAVPLPRLIRIDPPALTVTEREEMTA